jgi:hypothetical protein
VNPTSENRYGLRTVETLVRARVAAAVVGSIACHAFAIVAFVGGAGAATVSVPHPVVEDAPAAPSIADESATIELVVLHDPAPVETIALPASHASRPGRPATATRPVASGPSGAPPPLNDYVAAISAGAGRSGGAATVAETGTIGPGGGDVPDVGGTPGPRGGLDRGLSEDFVGTVLHHSRPVPKPADLPGARIEARQKQLRWEIAHGDHDAEQLQELRAELAGSWDDKDAEELQPVGGGRYKSEERTFDALVARDGTVKFKDKPEEMDAQYRVMLRHGIDPYARSKLAYLDRTRDQRVAIGEEYRKELLGRSVLLMRDNINWLVQTAPNLDARKQGLFQLWDECAETGNDNEVAAGNAARAFVMGYIRGKLPGAFSTSELARLNAKRQSRHRFEP